MWAGPQDPINSSGGKHAGTSHLPQVTSYLPETAQLAEEWKPAAGRSAALHFLEKPYIFAPLARSRDTNHDIRPILVFHPETSQCSSLPWNPPMIIPVTLLYPALTFYGFQSALFEVFRHIVRPRFYPGTNDTTVHLAVHPRCGSLTGTFSDVNAGLDMWKYKTIVSFGDSYTDGGRHDGGPLAPPVVIPPDPFAGGRSTNGKVWVEHLAEEVGATLLDYAWSSAVTNITLWPDNPYPRDFIMQTTTFLNQSHDLDPETTLYTVFFGINDWEDSFVDGNHLPQAAEDLLGQITLLSKPPTNARDFLVTDVYGRGEHNARGEAWVQSVFNGLVELHTQSSPHLNVAFANFATIWDGVLGSNPGYKAFGYVSTDACNPGITTATSCLDPDHYFYWFYGHPSRVTHKIMADYVNEVLELCRVL